jgi:hypothetical protein
MDFSELEKNRLDKILKMRERGVEPYPTRAKRHPHHAGCAAGF